MNWETIKQQLEHILNIPLRIDVVTFSDHSDQQNTSDQTDVSRLAMPNENLVRQLEESHSVVNEHHIYYLLERNGDHMLILVADVGHLTGTEQQLIQMTLEAYRAMRARQGTDMVGSEDEREAAELRDWLHDQLDQGIIHQALPETFAQQAAYTTSKVPLLLYGEYFDNKKVGYQDLKKLLDSFFDAETILIPLLDKEWLILCSDTLLLDEDQNSADEESREDNLASICLGLYGMMVSEGIGECHLSIHYPIVPATQLLRTVVQLREAIHLGKVYQVRRNIHLPWELQLEHIVHLLPESDKQSMLSMILKDKNMPLDSEMLLTLEEFFALDCNVSETAKKLYIHRNTLTYRLDRFKQDTGLDVRMFSHAVLAKIGLLLYKVTKRE